jgi:hypothetical protein
MAFQLLNSIRRRLLGMTAVFLAGAAAALAVALVSMTVLECLVLMARAPGD